MSEDRGPPSSGRHSSRPLSPITGYPSGYRTLPPSARKPARRVLVRHDACGDPTHLPPDLADTIEADPLFYSDLWCSTCKAYFPAVGPLGVFSWANWQTRVGEE